MEKRINQLPKSTNESGEDSELEGLMEAVVNPTDWSQEDDEKLSSELTGEKEEEEPQSLQKSRDSIPRGNSYFRKV